ncbi:hypothetical protein TNCV_2721471 [Trichonephila clavipes]|nr:hypothetical protein TNCV_2721471 [Trichonephila clavipes]
MAVTDPQKANLLANTIKNNFIENNRMQDNYDQDDEVVTSAVNTFFSLPPSTQIEPVMPDEIINFIKNTSSKKAPGQHFSPLRHHLGHFVITSLASSELFDEPLTTSAKEGFELFVFCLRAAARSFQTFFAAFDFVVLVLIGFLGQPEKFAGCGPLQLAHLAGALADLVHSELILWITMDETATRSDVASTKVSDMFTTDPFCFDAVRANAKLDNCSTCAECEDLCDALEDILDALHKPDNNTPERLRVINEVQWIALKCSRKSTKLQCQEFKDYIKEIERLNTVKVPTATAASKTAKRRKNKRATGSPTPGNVGKKKCSHPTPLPLLSKAKRFRWREDISSDDSSEETEMTKDVSPAGRTFLPLTVTLLLARITIVTHLLRSRGKNALPPSLSMQEKCNRAVRTARETCRRTT